MGKRGPIVFGLFSVSGVIGLGLSFLLEIPFWVCATIAVVFGDVLYNVWFKGALARRHRLENTGPSMLSVGVHETPDLRSGKQHKAA